MGGVSPRVLGVRFARSFRLVRDPELGVVPRNTCDECIKFLEENVVKAIRDNDEESLRLLYEFFLGVNDAIMGDYDDAVGNMDLEVYLRVMMGDQLYEELMDRLSQYARRKGVG